MTVIVPVLLALATLLAPPTSGEVVSVTLTEGPRDGNTAPLLKLHSGVAENWVARANFTDQTFQNGWAFLEVETRAAAASDRDQAYSAGYVEGAASHAIIYNSWRNVMEGYCDWQGQEYCTKLRQFITANFAWMESMIEQHAHTDPLWHQASLVLAQLEGLVAGYTEHAAHVIPAEEILWMNMGGDLEDLESALKASPSSRALRGDGRCSALVKLLPGSADLYVSHVTWNSLQSMLRMQKKYILPFQSLESGTSDDTVPGHTAAFSSYPGIIHSADDYYLLSSGLVTMETTIGNSNPDLWADVTPDGEMQEWIRVLIANRLAVDGSGWCDAFKQHNSGTYNNQWMIVDYKRFTPYKVIRPGTLWVLEQIPGLVVAEDQSQHLQRAQYWPSYNVPYYEEVFNASGIPALVEQYGDWFSYDNTPRALIFARDQGKVRDLGSMIKLMRYNDFQHDPLSKCDCNPPYSAENAISARNDLNPKNGTYPFGALGHRSHAGTDMKVTTSALFPQLQYLAVSGPSHESLPVFKWSSSDFANDTAHYGHPDVWDFPVIHVSWVW